MIGASISRWTMSYFATALAWLFVALALMVAGFGFPAAHLASPDTLVLVHVVCIGWLSVAMCGALFQFVPVLVAKPLFSEKWALPALRSVDRRSRLAARGLSGIGRPASRLALASSARRGPAHCRVRPGRRRSRVDGMAAAGGSAHVSFSSGWLRSVPPQPSARSLRLRMRGGRDRSGECDIGSRRSAARDRRAWRLADVDGHGRELPAALDVHALARCR